MTYVSIEPGGSGWPLVVVPAHDGASRLRTNSTLVSSTRTCVQPTPTASAVAAISRPLVKDDVMSHLDGTGCHQDDCTAQQGDARDGQPEQRLLDDRLGPGDAALLAH